MDYEMALQEQKTGIDLVLELRHVINQSSRSDGSLLLLEEAIKTFTGVLPVLSQVCQSTAADDAQMMISSDQCNSVNGGRSSRPDISTSTGGRRKRRYPCYWRTFTKNPQDGDGYLWKKYGQKGILGAKHQRNYFRCSHRGDQGCRAIKHVQRSNDDQSVFVISYIGQHTCKKKAEPKSSDRTVLNNPLPKQPFIITFGSQENQYCPDPSLVVKREVSIGGKSSNPTTNQQESCNGSSITDVPSRLTSEVRDQWQEEHSKRSIGNSISTDHEMMNLITDIDDYGDLAANFWFQNDDFTLC